MQMMSSLRILKIFRLVSLELELYLSLSVVERCAASVWLLWAELLVVAWVVAWAETWAVVPFYLQAFLPLPLSLCCCQERRWTFSLMICP